MFRLQENSLEPSLVQAMTFVLALLIMAPRSACYRRRFCYKVLPLYIRTSPVNSLSLLTNPTLPSEHFGTNSSPIFCLLETVFWTGDVVRPALSAFADDAMRQLRIVLTVLVVLLLTTQQLLVLSQHPWLRLLAFRPEIISIWPT